MLIRVGILTAPDIRCSVGHTLADVPTSVIQDVRIGIGFHWDRTEQQEFEGRMEILHNPDGTMTAVNILDLETYLVSVISSEMSASAPIELLKAHAVISRSWAVRAVEANRAGASSLRLRAYESNGHTGYDVCADDHCQRYEGIRRVNSRAREAVEATQGQVLVYGDKHEVCDCRYHKCCGGLTEVFSTCWQNMDVPYLQSVQCTYCADKDSLLRAGALNDYDSETTDYHDWSVSYTPSQLSAIVRDKTGVDFGEIVDLVPLERGKSGRICSLKIVGTRAEKVIGKELAIRRALSPTCLYSSWFDVERTSSGSFILNGHGWGHGVGLCQIGAAIMALKGFSYQQILSHYYPGTSLLPLGS